MPTDLPSSLADAWQPLGTRSGSTSVLVASITAETTLYEPVDEPATAAIGAGDIPVRSLFAVDLSISPPLSAIGIAPDAALSKAAPKAKSQFVDTVADDGLTVEETRDVLEFEGPNGAVGRWYVLDVSYTVDSEQVSNGTDQLAAEANVAVWPTAESYGVAGGVLPLESVVEQAADSAGRSELESGLNVNPERDRETIATLIRSIDFGDDATEADDVAEDDVPDESAATSDESPDADA
ncbi:uncharacterized protein Nmag_1233 [Natrialba magadii ATCC 43099]|uniref:Uncharacterized protein n=1 Tax=Natrialba magadii (strain ATCC 43099 / DSM 3394 / CCM 3739 / CIP 104546 / IAM 13178 / JCM 8861 / NBRC 102185 / NCIMB 2190 / MS3) TaxID=547559 RepID=D3SS89_NATMM|nr:hypothetical protein [Natrialba magadii]ADD04815.1 uncharacterized protein Nmag_1233 [Natrialba magadii ATCC 43099]ELY24482.1 hypothetical protein C500_18680 [Natrialba magadii ATCC 43099]